MPKVIFLQAPELSGWYVRLKNYENGHKNIFGLSVVLELKVKKKQQNSDFPSHFSTSKIDQLLHIFFFDEEYKKRGATFDNFDF